MVTVTAVPDATFVWIGDHEEEARLVETWTMFVLPSVNPVTSNKKWPAAIRGEPRLIAAPWDTVTVIALVAVNPYESEASAINV